MHSTWYARVSGMHSVKPRENQEDLALNSGEASVTELESVMSDHVLCNIRLQQQRRIIAYRRCSPEHGGDSTRW